MPILTALMRSLRDIFRPRVLAVLFLPMVGAILVWSVLAFIFWGSWVSAMESAIDTSSIGRWLVVHGAGWANVSGAVLALLAMLLAAVLITAVIITETIAMPVIVSVASTSYPRLEKANGGTMLGSVGNACVAVLVFSLLWIGSLPLWFTGIGAIVLPALNSAYLQQRLFRYDALSEHASREEYRELVRLRKGRLYMLGLSLAVLYYVPFVQLIAPVISGLAFTHYCLGELARMRAKA